MQKFNKTALCLMWNIVEGAVSKRMLSKTVIRFSKASAISMRVYLEVNTSRPTLLVASIFNAKSSDTKPKNFGSLINGLIIVESNMIKFWIGSERSGISRF
ncbi:hypothetical protein WICPIJ_005922 [Wickerhamomyces pijperi]|uniref:Uncharacterized protein n=1 Tax=Wickerhamomyces pijperi TaxID=599730 RepID=A0A9P8Q4S4_WICPI|nr:hypothetical protein WICPIJ_005922 [Wickerhamomyces pijperi]